MELVRCLSCDWPAIEAADRDVELWVGATENVHGELARTGEAADVAEREVRDA